MPLLTKLFVVSILLLVTLGASAQDRDRSESLFGPSVQQNPALPAYNPPLSLGDDQTVAFVEAGGLSGVWDLQSHAWTTGIAAPWQGPFRAGISLSSEGANSSLTTNLGVVVRPWRLWSAGATVENLGSSDRIWGLGLGLRPLTLWWPSGDWLTLTGDSSWSVQGWTADDLGLSLDWGAVAARFWYRPWTNSAFGAALIVRWGGVSATVSNSSSTWQGGGSWSYPNRTSFGQPREVLRLSGGGTIQSAPYSPLSWPFGSSKASLPELIELLKKASEDPNLDLVLWENPPQVDGLAQAETLRDAIRGLQKAGKKLWVYADDYSDALGFEGWVSVADKIILAPTGTLDLRSEGSRRLYWKDLFDKWGIQVFNYAPWETKSAYNGWSFASMPDGERTMLTRFLTDRQDQAEHLLEKGRGHRLRLTGHQALVQGPWLVASDALNAGLVDSLSSRLALEDEATKAGDSLVDSLDSTFDRRWGSRWNQVDVARVFLDGDIVGGPGTAGKTIGQDAVEALRNLRRNPDIRAVVLEVDSPGGGVTPSDALAEQVKALVDEGKPVVVVMGDLAASGGYYLSAQASHIIARGTTLTGSIGVTAAQFTAQKALENLGVHPDGVALSPNATFGSWTAPSSPEEQQRWHLLILAAYDRFLGVVAQGRHLEKDKLEPLARGQIYTGREALALGLVDELGGDAQARAWLEKTLKKSVKWIDIVPGENNPWATALAPFAEATLEASSPVWRAASSTQQVWGPLAEQWEQLTELGPGPWLWTDQR